MTPTPKDLRQSSGEIRCRRAPGAFIDSESQLCAARQVGLGIGCPRPVLGGATQLPQRFLVFLWEGTSAGWVMVGICFTGGLRAEHGRHLGARTGLVVMLMARVQAVKGRK